MRPRYVRNWLPPRFGGVTSSERHSGGLYDDLARGARSAFGVQADRRTSAKSRSCESPQAVPAKYLLLKHSGVAPNTMAPSVLSSNVAVNQRHHRNRPVAAAWATAPSVAAWSVVVSGRLSGAATSPAP